MADFPAIASVGLMVSFDPGYAKSNATGRACFWYGELVHVEAYSSKKEHFLERFEDIAIWAERVPVNSPVHFLVVEFPQIYPGPQQKGDPNDEVKLAGLAGRLTGCVKHSHCRMPLPREWKGNVRKDVMLERIEKRLRPAELAVLEGAKGKRDAVLDAIGIGLDSLGRLNIT